MSAYNCIIRVCVHCKSRSVYISVSVGKNQLDCAGGRYRASGLDGTLRIRSVRKWFVQIAFAEALRTLVNMFRWPQSRKDQGTESMTVQVGVGCQVEEQFLVTCHSHVVFGSHVGSHLSANLHVWDRDLRLQANASSLGSPSLCSPPIPVLP